MLFRASRFFAIAEQAERRLFLRRWLAQYLLLECSA